jgi:hypothetical protein
VRSLSFKRARERSISSTPAGLRGVLAGAGEWSGDTAGGMRGDLVTGGDETSGEMGAR